MPEPPSSERLQPCETPDSPPEASDEDTQPKCRAARALNKKRCDILPEVRDTMVPPTFSAIAREAGVRGGRGKNTRQN